MNHFSNKKKMMPNGIKFGEFFSIALPYTLGEFYKWF